MIVRILRPTPCAEIMEQDGAWKRWQSRELLGITYVLQASRGIKRQQPDDVASPECYRDVERKVLRRVEWST